MTLKARQLKFAKEAAAIDAFFVAHPSGGIKATVAALKAALARGPDPTRLNQPSREFVPDDVRAEWQEAYRKEFTKRLQGRIRGGSRGKLTTHAPEMLELIRELAMGGDGRLRERAEALLAKIEEES